MNMTICNFINLKHLNYKFVIINLFFYLHSRNLANCSNFKSTKQTNINLIEKIDIFYLDQIYEVLRCENQVGLQKRCDKSLDCKKVKQPTCIYFLTEDFEKIVLNCDICYFHTSTQKNDKRKILYTLKSLGDTRLLFDMTVDNKFFRGKMMEIVMENFFIDKKNENLNETHIRNKGKLFFSIHFLIKNFYMNHSYDEERTKYRNLYESLRLKSIELFNRNENIIPKYVIDVFNTRTGILRCHNQYTSYIIAALQMLKVVYENSKANGLKITDLLSQKNNTLNFLFYTLERLTFACNEIDINELLMFMEESNVKFDTESQEFRSSNSGMPQKFLKYIFNVMKTSQSQETQDFFNKFLFFEDQDEVNLPMLSGFVNQFYFLVGSDRSKKIFGENFEFIVVENYILMNPKDKTGLETYFNTTYQFKDINFKYRCLSAIFYNDLVGRYVYVDRESYIDGQQVISFQNFLKDSSYFQNEKKIRTILLFQII